MILTVLCLFISLSSLLQKYDYESIMQYKENAFAFNGQITIKTLDPAFQKKIGQRKTLSKLDLKDLNKYFGCKGGVGFAYVLLYDCYILEL